MPLINWDLMKPGEIYSPDPTTGTGGQYISPALDAMDPREQVALNVGYYDSMQRRAPFADADRLSAIQAQTGAQMDVSNPFYQPGTDQFGADIMGNTPQNFDPRKADAYDRMSPADHLAIDLVRSGKMDAGEWYKIKKADEMKRDQVVVGLLGRDPDRMELSRDGRPADVNAGNLLDLMDPAGQTSVEWGPVEKNVNMNYSGGAGRGGAAPGAGRAAPVGGGTPATAEETKAWQDFLQTTTAAENTLSGMYTDSKSFDKDQIARQQDRVNQMRLTRELYEANSALGLIGASNLATQNVRSGKLMFADTDSAIVHDSTGAKLNARGTITLGTGKYMPISQVMSSTNPATGQLWTVDEILRVLQKPIATPAPTSSGATRSF